MTTTELQKRDQESLRDRSVMAPRVDIHETPHSVVLTADLPGANKDAIDVMVERNQLVIDAKVDWSAPSGYSLVHGEFGVVDYRRSFTLSDEVNREKISATFTDGVLRLELPKSEATRSRKISIKS